MMGRIPAVLPWPTTRVDREKYQRNLIHRLTGWSSDYAPTRSSKLGTRTCLSRIGALDSGRRRSLWMGKWGLTPSASRRGDVPRLPPATYFTRAGRHPLQRQRGAPV